MSKSSVHVTVTKDVPLENQEKWLEMTQELAAETWKEAGCITYEFVRSTEKEDRFVIVEEWESQAHLNDHAETPHFERLVPLMDDISTTVALDVSQRALPITRDPASDRKRRNGRILIVYDTSTGSTAQIASLIADGVRLLDRMEVRVRVVPGEHTSWEDSSVQRDKLHPFPTHNDIF